MYDVTTFTGCKNGLRIHGGDVHHADVIFVFKNMMYMMYGQFTPDVYRMLIFSVLTQVSVLNLKERYTWLHPYGCLCIPSPHVVYVHIHMHYVGGRIFPVLHSCVLN